MRPLRYLWRLLTRHMQPGRCPTCDKDIEVDIFGRVVTHHPKPSADDDYPWVRWCSGQGSRDVQRS